MGEEEATATARRLCRSYLEHRGMRVVDDGSAGGTIVARDDGELSSWILPPSAESWVFGPEAGLEQPCYTLLIHALYRLAK